jgi:hypothetical protein
MKIVVRNIFFIIVYAISAIACFRVAVDGVNILDTIINGIIAVVLLLLMLWTGMARSFELLDEIQKKLKGGKYGK